MECMECLFAPYCVAIFRCAKMCLFHGVEVSSRAPITVASNKYRVGIKSCISLEAEIECILLVGKSWDLDIPHRILPSRYLL